VIGKSNKFDKLNAVVTKRSVDVSCHGGIHTQLCWKCLIVSIPYCRVIIQIAFTVSAWRHVMSIFMHCSLYL